VNGAMLMSLLRMRLLGAAERLEAYPLSLPEASRIRNKAEGVRLAVVYVEDELRLCGDAA
jgi:hypothetical protein